MKIEMHRSFERSYLDRIANNIKLKKKFKERLLAFEFDRKDPVLKDHALIGKKLD